MKNKSFSWIIFSLFLFICLVSSNPVEIQKMEEVLILRSMNFDKALKNNQKLLVLFHAPWCYQCRTFFPEFQRTAKILKDEGYRIALGAVDVNFETELMLTHKVTEYPTLKFFFNGNYVEDYNGGRSTQDVINWIIKKTDHPCIAISNPEQLERLRFSNELIAIFWGNSNSSHFNIYETISREFSDIPFVFTTSTEIKKRFVPEGKNFITLIRSFEEPIINFNQDLTKDNLRVFIQKNKDPKVSVFNEKYAKLVFGDKKPLLFVLIDGKDKETNNNVWETMIKVSEKLGGKILLSIVYKESEWGTRLTSQFKSANLSLPFVAILKPLSNYTQKYISKEILTQDNIIKFYESFVSDKLHPFYRSEPVPTINNGTILKAVGSTFEKIVMDKTKDVFVLLHAPWCQHSKATYVVLKDLADHVQPISDLIIVKIDATANDIEGLNIKTIPYLLFYPSNDKKNPIKYEGDRTFDPLWEWLRSVLTVSYNPGLLWQNSPIRKRGLTPPPFPNIPNNDERLGMDPRRMPHPNMPAGGPAFGVPQDIQPENKEPSLESQQIPFVGLPMVGNPAEGVSTKDVEVPQEKSTKSGAKWVSGQNEREKLDL